MIKLKLQLYTGILLLTIGGCTKACYKCNQPIPIYYICESSNDTLGIFGWKNTTDLLQKIQYYSSNGYHCFDSVIPIANSGFPYTEVCASKEEYLSLKWQGFDCYKTNKQ